MKTIAMLLCCAGILAARLAIVPPPADDAGGAPAPTIRVTVSNSQPNAVEVWWIAEGMGPRRFLGLVPGVATRSFRLSAGEDVVRIMVEPAGGGEGYVSGVVVVGPETGVILEVVEPIGGSRIKVVAFQP